MSLLREDKRGKVDYSYLWLVGGIDRVMARFKLGELKYSKLNWREATDNATFQESMMRHGFQYLRGELDEDHLAGLIVNALILMDLEEQDG